MVARVRDPVPLPPRGYRAEYMPERLEGDLYTTGGRSIYV